MYVVCFILHNKCFRKSFKIISNKDKRSYFYSKKQAAFYRCYLLNSIDCVSPNETGLEPEQRRVDILSYLIEEVLAWVGLDFYTHTPLLRYSQVDRLLLSSLQTVSSSVYLKRTFAVISLIDFLTNYYKHFCERNISVEFVNIRNYFHGF